MIKSGFEVFGGAASGAAAGAVSSMTSAAFDTETTNGAANPNGRGLVYLSDGIYQCVWTGSAWEYYWNTRLVLRPRIADFPASLDATGTATDSSGILITGTGATGITRARNLPASSNYRVEVGIEYSQGNEAYPALGLFLRSATGEKATIDVQYQASAYQLHLQKLNANGSYNSAYNLQTMANWGLGSAACSVIFFAIVDDGTNRIYYVSQNGKHWLRIQTIGRTDFLTPTMAGFQISGTGAHSPSARIFHWKQA